jgi:hypothetical protein
LQLFRRTIGRAPKKIGPFWGIQDGPNRFFGYAKAFRLCQGAKGVWQKVLEVIPFDFFKVFIGD